MRRDGRSARSLVAWHCRTGHRVMAALSEGFVATAVALAWRAGIEVGIPEPGSGHGGRGVQCDVQNSVASRAASGVVASALEKQAQEINRWMAR
ncbi:DUF6086 family protein [Streptomyces klenkii]|uniref:DUF6086 family protein n=1 Tax=Streptomyces klenkii TaxID=1420899 RepID=UPI0034393686